jgi:hypothetical protein
MSDFNDAAARAGIEEEGGPQSIFPAEVLMVVTGDHEIRL